jgi:hypothetical protein
VSAIFVQFQAKSKCAKKIQNFTKLRAVEVQLFLSLRTRRYNQRWDKKDEISYPKCDAVLPGQGFCTPQKFVMDEHGAMAERSTAEENRSNSEKTPAPLPPGVPKMSSGHHGLNQRLGV